MSLNTLKLAGQCGKLKCCLNYELDTYMDALRDIPDDVDKLETIKGMARLQKTDIFKKLMWFSYPNEESWIPLDIKRVREIQQMNKQGEKPEDLKDEAVEIEPAPVAKVLDYENVVGQDSITRLDEKSNKKKKKRGGKNRNRQENNGGQHQAGEPSERDRDVVKAKQQDAPARQQPNKQQQPAADPQNKPADQQNKKAHGPRHFRRNKNNNRPKSNE